MARKSSTAHWTSPLSAAARCHQDQDHPQCRNQQVLRCWRWASSVLASAVVAIIENPRLPKQGCSVGSSFAGIETCGHQREIVARLSKIWPILLWCPFFECSSFSSAYCSFRHIGSNAILQEQSPRSHCRIYLITKQLTLNENLWNITVIKITV